MKTRQPTLFVTDRAAQDPLDFVFVERIQHQHSRTRKQCADNFERRILSRRANQRDGSIFNRRQQRILLRFVEAMNLIDEQNGAPAAQAVEPRLGNRAAQLFHAGKYSRERNEVRARSICQQACQCRLSRAWRAPENH